MTDLEKLAKQFLSKDFSDDVKDTDGIAISDDDRDIVPLVAILEQTRAAGRIEGLKEAAALAKTIHQAGVEVDARIGRMAYNAQTVDISIRARIQELEDEK